MHDINNHLLLPNHEHKLPTNPNYKPIYCLLIFFGVILSLLWMFVLFVQTSDIEIVCNGVTVGQPIPHSLLTSTMDEYQRTVEEFTETTTVTRVEVSHNYSSSVDDVCLLFYENESEVVLDKQLVARGNYGR